LKKLVFCLFPYNYPVKMMSKITLIREFFLGAGMTAFLCFAPQNDPIFTLALFVGMFTFYETFPEFHWAPAVTLWKIIAKEEDVAQGVVRLVVQFLAATLAAIVGYKLLDFSDNVAHPSFRHEDEWRALLWTALVWGAWISLCNHGGKKDKGSLRRNLALTFTFCSGNYLLQGIASDCILNTAVNFGRFIGAKIYIDGKEDVLTSAPDMKKLWLIVCGPLLGVALAWVFLKFDESVAAWDAPEAGGEETTAIYGSTDKDNDAGKLELSEAEKKADENA